jgi:hypothetical protein
LNGIAHTIVLFSQSLLLNTYDFEFEGSPDDVGMKTGATIHTMNGLNMRARKLSKDETPPTTDGYWAKQHLKRGLTASGRPYQSTEDLEAQNTPKPDKSRVDPGTGVPMVDPELKQ